jgi:hypothetical protein
LESNRRGREESIIDWLVEVQSDRSGIHVKTKGAECRSCGVLLKEGNFQRVGEINPNNRVSLQVVLIKGDSRGRGAWLGWQNA